MFLFSAAVYRQANDTYLLGGESLLRGGGDIDLETGLRRLGDLSIGRRLLIGEGRLCGDTPGGVGGSDSEEELSVPASPWPLYCRLFWTDGLSGELSSLPAL